MAGCVIHMIDGSRHVFPSVTRQEMGQQIMSGNTDGVIIASEATLFARHIVRIHDWSEGR
jgi:hypothetical protein